MGKKAVAFVCSIAAIAAGGCSPVNLNSARDLAQTGQTGVAAFQSTYQSGITGSERMNEYLAFQQHLRAPGEQVRDHGLSSDQVAEIRRRLNARISVLQALNRTYGAFHDLAAFGNEGDLTASLQGLRNSVGAAGATFAGPAGGVAAGAIADPIVTIGGLLAEERQRRRVQRASVAIQNELRRFLTITESDQEIVEVVSVLQPVHTARIHILRQMWADRMISAAPLFRELVDNSTFALVDPSSPALTNANPRVDAIVRERLATQEREIRQRIVEVYNGHRTLFQHLIDEHQRLQDGESLDTARLRSYSTNIATLLGKLQVLAGTPVVHGRL
jgi:hypothetical protein